MYALVGFIFLTTHTATTHTDKRSTFGIFLSTSRFSFCGPQSPLNSRPSHYSQLVFSVQFKSSRVAAFMFQTVCAYVVCENSLSCQLHLSAGSAHSGGGDCGLQAPC